MEKTNEKIIVNVKEELERINSITIFEYQKTIDSFDIQKLKMYVAKDGEKTVSFLFYDTEFFAVDRINFLNNYEYDTEKEYQQISENLNYRIKKIPNVAKTRKILNIEDIETRIYDVSEYIVLLQKENIKLLKVHNQTEIKEMEYFENKLEWGEISDRIETYKEIEEDELRQQQSLKNKFNKIKVKFENIIIEPFKILKNKLFKSKEVKMLTDGKSSIFDK